MKRMYLCPAAGAKSQFGLCTVIMRPGHRPVVDYECSFDAAVDYEYGQVNGMDLRDCNGPSSGLLQEHLHGCNKRH